MNWKNILSRAGFAALAAFVGALTVPAVISDWQAWQGVGVAGLTAAVAAVVSTIKTIVQELVVGTTSIPVPTSTQE